MNEKMRSGSATELLVAAELLRLGVDVYRPLVDDVGVDLLVRSNCEGRVKHYDIQVKSVKGVGPHLGIKRPSEPLNPLSVLILFWWQDDAYEAIYLSSSQVFELHKDTSWGDLKFNKAEKTKYKHQTIAHLAARMKNCEEIH
jgi:hypothetical protein